FFFFQAEDGIRDFHVTGVQTCALPIFPPVCYITFIVVVYLLLFNLYAQAIPSFTVNSKYLSSSIYHIGGTTKRLPTHLTSPCFRSEERRVGKECRSRC